MKICTGYETDEEKRWKASGYDSMQANGK